MQKAGDLPYRLLEPSLASGARAPLIIFLHGVGERGTDNDAQFRYGFFKSARSLFGKDTSARQPFFVLAPQAPLEDKWVGIERWADPNYTMRPDPTPSMAKLIPLIDRVLAERPVDRDRVYAVGLSMGGYGVYDLVSRRPELFAAAAVVCGRGDPTAASALRRVPFFVAHGVKDKLVPVEFARAMVAALKKASSPHVYREYPDAGHDVWDRAFEDQDMIAWLFGQSRRPLG